MNIILDCLICYYAAGWGLLAGLIYYDPDPKPLKVKHVIMILLFWGLAILCCPFMWLEERWDEEIAATGKRGQRVRHTWRGYGFTKENR